MGGQSVTILGGKSGYEHDNVWLRACVTLQGVRSEQVAVYGHRRIFRCFAASAEDKQPPRVLARTLVKSPTVGVFVVGSYRVVATEKLVYAFVGNRLLIADRAELAAAIVRVSNTSMGANAATTVNNTARNFNQGAGMSTDPSVLTAMVNALTAEDGVIAHKARFKPARCCWSPSPYDNSVTADLMRSGKYVYRRFHPLVSVVILVLAMLVVVPWPVRVCNQVWYKIEWSSEELKLPYASGIGFLVAAVAYYTPLGLIFSGPVWFAAYAAYNLFSPAFEQAALRLPTPSFGTVCQWSYGWFTWQYAATRLAMVCVIVALTAQGAYAQPVPFPYDFDRYAPLNWSGPLPVKAGSFQLPGYIADVPIKEKEPTAKYRVKDLGKDDVPPIDKPALFGIGLVFGFAIPLVAYACARNLKVAVQNRQIAKMPQPDPAVFLGWADQFLWKMRGIDWTFTVVTHEEWNARFPPERRRQHDEARIRYQDGQGGYSWREFAWVREMFSKVEKIFKRSPYDPRAISGGSAMWNILAGPVLYSFSKSLMEAFPASGALVKGFEFVFYATSTTSAELGKWFMAACAHGTGIAVHGDDIYVIMTLNGRLVFVEVDGKRHDAHMHYYFWWLKWEVYRIIVVMSGRSWTPRYGLISASQARTKASSRSGVKCEYENRVRSGDPDTSGGNSLCTIFISTVVRSLLTAGLGPEGVAEYFACKMGYEVEIKVENLSAHTTFLSGTFVPVDGVVFWTPKIGRLIASLGWSHRNPFTREEAWQRYAGTLNSFAPYQFLPFFRIYYARVRSLIPEEYRDAVSFEKRTVLVNDVSYPTEPGPDTWQFIFERYNLTHADELSFGSELSEATSLPFMLGDGVARTLFDVDVY
jgi:hypothetical protein